MLLERVALASVLQVGDLDGDLQALGLERREPKAPATLEAYVAERDAKGSAA